MIKYTIDDVDDLSQWQRECNRLCHVIAMVTARQDEAKGKGIRKSLPESVSTVSFLIR